jgi:hypothetical protein
MVFERSVLRRIFEPKMDEVTEEWRKRHNEELNYLRWEGHVARMGEGRVMYGNLIRKPEVKRPVGRHMHRWEDNIKADLQEVRCGDMNWFELAQNRNSWLVLVNAVMNVRVP